MKAESKNGSLARADLVGVDFCRRVERRLLTDVLHRLHKLLLLLLLKLGLLHLRRPSHLFGCIECIGLGGLLVQVFGECLRHGNGLVGELQGTFLGKADLVLLLHLVDFGLLLLHNLGQLQLVVQVRTLAPLCDPLALAFARNLLRLPRLLVQLHPSRVFLKRLRCRLVQHRLRGRLLST